MTKKENAIEYFEYCLTELKMDTPAIRETYELAIEALRQTEEYKRVFMLIGETLVEESKLHIDSYKACKQIRGYLQEIRRGEEE